MWRLPPIRCEMFSFYFWRVEIDSHCVHLCIQHLCRTKKSHAIWIFPKTVPYMWKVTKMPLDNEWPPKILFLITDKNVLDAFLLIRCYPCQIWHCVAWRADNLPLFSECQHGVLVQGGEEATISPNHSEISIHSLTVNLRNLTCSCLYPQSAGMPCSHVLAVMRTPNAFVPGNNMTAYFSINLNSSAFVRWIHQSWLLNYQYSLDKMRIAMLSVEHLVLDDVTLPNKRKAEAPTKGLQQSKMFRSLAKGLDMLGVEERWLAHDSSRHTKSVKVDQLSRREVVPFVERIHIRLRLIITSHRMPIVQYLRMKLRYRRWWISPLCKTWAIDKPKHATWILHSFIQDVCVCVCVFLGRFEEKYLWKCWWVTAIRDSKIRHWTRRGVRSLSVYGSYYTSHITPQPPSYVWEPPVQDRPDFFSKILSRSTVDLTDTTFLTWANPSPVNRTSSPSCSRPQSLMSLVVCVHVCTCIQRKRDSDSEEIRVLIDSDHQCLMVSKQHTPTPTPRKTKAHTQPTQDTHRHTHTHTLTYMHTQHPHHAPYLQHTAPHSATGNYNTLQRTLEPAVTRCKTLQCALQHTATHVNTLQRILQHTATHSNTHFHTLTTYNTLRGDCTAHRNKLYHTATHCNGHCNTRQHTATHCNAHCNTVRNTQPTTATHCNTLEHTARQLHHAFWRVQSRNLGSSLLGDVATSIKCRPCGFGPVLCVYLRTCL